MTNPFLHNSLTLDHQTIFKDGLTCLRDHVVKGGSKRAIKLLVHFIIQTVIAILTVDRRELSTINFRQLGCEKAANVLQESEMLQRCRIQHNWRSIVQEAPSGRHLGALPGVTIVSYPSENYMENRRIAHPIQLIMVFKLRFLLS